jgi:predicted HAD superfamily Cof-like phosphohydrolase
MTDFNKVCEFNRSFDFPVHKDMMDEKCRKLRLDLIEEELNELQKAFEENDFVEEQDACADILYVAYGMAYTYQINSDFVMYNGYYVINKETLFKSLAYNLNDRKTILKKLFDTFNNLVKYTNEQNRDRVVEFLHEIIYYVYNFQFVSGYDSDRIFQIVHDSNMSKLCKDEVEAQLTVEDYEQKYLNGSSPYDSPYYYKLDNELYVIKNKSTGKALKNINYTKVKLT